MVAFSKNNKSIRRFIEDYNKLPAIHQSLLPNPIKRALFANPFDEPAFVKSFLKPLTLLDHFIQLFIKFECVEKFKNTPVYAIFHLFRENAVPADEEAEKIILKMAKPKAFLHLLERHTFQSQLQLQPPEIYNRMVEISDVLDPIKDNPVVITGVLRLIQANRESVAMPFIKNIKSLKKTHQLTLELINIVIRHPNQAQLAADIRAIKKLGPNLVSPTTIPLILKHPDLPSAIACFKTLKTYRQMTPEHAETLLSGSKDLDLTLLNALFNLFGENLTEEHFSALVKYQTPLVLKELIQTIPISLRTANHLNTILHYKPPEDLMIAIETLIKSSLLTEQNLTATLACSNPSLISAFNSLDKELCAQHYFERFIHHKNQLALKLAIEKLERERLLDSQTLDQLLKQPDPEEFSMNILHQKLSA